MYEDNLIKNLLARVSERNKLTLAKCAIRKIICIKVYPVIMHILNMKKNAPDSLSPSFFSVVDVSASSWRILTTSGFVRVASKPRKASIRACLMSPLL